MLRSLAVPFVSTSLHQSQTVLPVVVDEVVVVSIVEDVVVDEEVAEEVLVEVVVASAIVVDEEVVDVEAVVVEAPTVVVSVTSRARSRLSKSITCWRTACMSTRPHI